MAYSGTDLAFSLIIYDLKDDTTHKLPRNIFLSRICPCRMLTTAHDGCQICGDQACHFVMDHFGMICLHTYENIKFRRQYNEYCYLHMFARLHQVYTELGTDMKAAYLFYLYCYYVFCCNATIKLKVWNLRELIAA
jgi:hypothetical protein